MHSLESYRAELARVRAFEATPPENFRTSCPADLMRGLGATLKAKVLRLIQMTSGGASVPGSGFFTREQPKSAQEVRPPGCFKSLRAVIEVKPLDAHSVNCAQALLTKYRGLSLPS